jgi:hypothetical protein
MGKFSDVTSYDICKSRFDLSDDGYVALRLTHSKEIPIIAKINLKKGFKFEI